LFKESCIYCVEEFVDVFSIKMCVMTIGLGHSLHWTDSFCFQEESFEELGFRDEDITLLSAHKSMKSTAVGIQLICCRATCSSSASNFKMAHTVAYQFNKVLVF
jgi:hypothetical protein